MKISKIALFSLLSLLCCSATAFAEPLQVGTYRGTLQLDKQFSESALMPRTILFVARIAKSGKVLSLKNLRGNSYTIRQSSIEPSRYLGSTNARIYDPQSNSCDPNGTPSLIVSQKGKKVIEVHQTITFAGCRDADAMPFAVQYHYSGRLVRDAR